jgi:hypothetical protein
VETLYNLSKALLTQTTFSLRRFLSSSNDSFSWVTTISTSNTFKYGVSPIKISGADDVDIILSREAGRDDVEEDVVDDVVVVEEQFLVF